MRAMGRASSDPVSFACFIQFEEFVKVLRGSVAHFFKRQIAYLADLPGYFLHVGGLVPLPAVGDWRQIRRIGFDQHAIEGNKLRGVADILRFRESDVTGER